MKLLTALFMALLLVACGGGSGSDVAIPKPAENRTDLLFGYYLTSPTQYQETKNHINMMWVGGPWGVDGAITNMQQSMLPSVLDVSEQVYLGGGHSRTLNPGREANLRQLFTRLQEANVLQYILGICPVDEPDIAVANQADVLEANKSARRVAAEFLSRVKLVAIFAGTKRLTNIQDFDIVGFDDYEAKSGIFTNGQYARFVASLLPSQQIILIPGGYIGQDPEPFLNWAQADKRVIGIVAFLWADASEFVGIRSLPVKQAYCAAGESVVRPGVVGTGIC